MTRCWAFMLLLLFSGVLVLSVEPMQAQTSGWSLPVKFVDVGKDGWVQTPRLIRDSGGNLHAFWYARLTEEEPSAVYYSLWDGTEWSEPVDVLLSPDGGSIWWISLGIDQDDYVYAFWASGSGIWYSLAHASQLGDAQSWAAPQAVTTAYPPSTHIDLAQDDQGTWFLVYPDHDQDRISVVRSTDNAATWSMETVAYLELRPDRWASYPGILVAPDGALWIWWAELDPEGSGAGHAAFFYARSADGGRTWSEPQQVTSGYYNGRYDVVGDVMVRLVGGGVGVGGRYIAFSHDNGTTWTEPRDISSGAGDGMQKIDLVVDSAGTLHFVEQTGGSFATVAWDGETWSPIDFIASEGGERSENVVAAISESNRMHVFYEEADRVLWHTSRLLDAPYVPPRPPRPIAVLDQEATSEPTVASESRTPVTDVRTPSTPGPVDGSDTNPGVQSGTPWLPVAIGVLPVALIVVTVLVIRAGRGRSRGRIFGLVWHDNERSSEG